MVEYIFTYMKTHDFHHTNQPNQGGLGPIPQWFGTLLQDLMLPTDSKLRDWDVVGTVGNASNEGFLS